jgi:hypothetical protein
MDPLSGPGTASVAKRSTAIIADFVSFIQTAGGDIREWYVGVTDILDRRLRREHRLDTRKASWTWAPASSEEEARRAERFMVYLLGAEGGAHGLAGRIVYTYRKSPGTRP